ncbi:MAG: GNAT family N-acetyltransferase [Pseudomonadota bacterium]
MVSIRPAIPSDIDRIAQLHAASWQSAYAGDFSTDRLNGSLTRELMALWDRYESKPTDIVLVAENDDPSRPLLGFCAIWCEETPYLDNLHVLPNAKGRGIGRSLLAEAAAELKRRGFTTLYLTVFETNAAARKFYASLEGREVAVFVDDIFGDPVPSVKVVWDELSALL